MPTYIYETTGKAARRFEVKQGMKEAPLTHDPETGEPVRRVISGGYGYLEKAKPGSRPASMPSGGGSCGSGCGCH